MICLNSAIFLASTPHGLRWAEFSIAEQAILTRRFSVIFRRRQRASGEFADRAIETKRQF